MKKTFEKEVNAAMQFISQSDKGIKKAKNELKGFKAPHTETKNRRLTLLMKPSLFERLKEHTKDETSVNNYINALLEKALSD
jgi:hypothetical protein